MYNVTHDHENSQLTQKDPRDTDSHPIAHRDVHWLDAVINRRLSSVDC